MLNSKSSSINLSRVNANKRKDNTLGTSVASQDKRSNYGVKVGPISRPRVNASNNVNGDEFNKVHGAEGGFFCQ